jgi:tetratricopeptide (TPR) repeat protein
LAADIRALIQKCKPAVVQIGVFDGEGKLLATGTGFFISPTGDLLTNYHVIVGASRILARDYKGAIFHLKKIVAFSPKDDVVELQFDAATPIYLNLGSATSAVEGQHITVIGNPDGLEFTVSDGIISAFRQDRSYIQLTAPISHGSSGSPVLDDSGQVLGIIKSIDTEGQNLNFAISSETIREAIASFKEWNKMGTPVEQQPGGLLIRPDPSGGYSLVPQATPTPTWEPPVTDRIMPTTPPGAVATPAPSTAESTDVFQIAFIAWKTGNYEMAISGFDETIQRWPRSARAWALRGDAQRHLKHYGNAIRDYTEAIRLSPGSDFSYEGRSKVFETLGDHVKAAQDLRKARELRKNK